MKCLDSSLDILQSHWERLLQPFQVESRNAQAIFLDLVAAYSSTGRFYHTLEHIQHTLETIESLRSLAIDFSAIQLAAWFHDVIYDARANDNEEKSAQYAVAALNQLKLPISTVERVKNLILSTRTHQAQPQDTDCQILLDADLAILGATEADYKVYTQAIRQEYAWIADQLYHIGRKQVLQTFLERQRIYFTNPLFESLEVRARQNIQAEITALELFFLSAVDSRIIGKIQ